MEHIAAFMLLVGCSGDAQACRELPVMVPAYEDVAQCTQDLHLQMRLNGAAAEKVYGVCKEVDEETFEQSGTVNWSITKDGRINVQFDAEPQIVAS